jgi:hypothetical protein
MDKVMISGASDYNKKGERDMTVNEAMALMKVVRERVGDMKQLRTQVAVKTKERRGYGENQYEEESDPQYDAKSLDRRIVELQNWLFIADAAVKQSNARTDISIPADVEKLLAPLE